MYSREYNIHHTDKSKLWLNTECNINQQMDKFHSPWTEWKIKVYLLQLLNNVIHGASSLVLCMTWTSLAKTLIIQKCWYNLLMNRNVVQFVHEPWLARWGSASSNSLLIRSTSFKGEAPSRVYKCMFHMLQTISKCFQEDATVPNVIYI